MDDVLIKVVQGRFSMNVQTSNVIINTSLRTTYFQEGNMFFQQKFDMAVGTPLSPGVSDMYIKHFEQLSLPKYFGHTATRRAGICL